MTRNLSSEIFDKANEEWQGVAANKIDLIDPNLSFTNTTFINFSIINNIENLMKRAIEISNQQENSNEFDNIIEQALNDEFNSIIPNILSDSIYNFNFSISKSPLHILFFNQFDLIYKNFEMNLNQIDETNNFTNIWKDFINNINNIYLNIADIFWEEKKIFYPAALKKAKIRAAKARMFSEAKNIYEIEKNTIYEESIPNPTNKKVKEYKSINGIPGLQYIFGKKYFINLNFIL
jgi:hypothetical protein